MWLVASGPPTSPWDLPAEVKGQVWHWLQMTLYVTLAGSIAAVIIFGALLAIDRNRGEPVSATSPAVRALRIALGVMVMTSALTLAQWFT
nr:hypothetical protein [Corynebacterium lactis]